MEVGGPDFFKRTSLAAELEKDWWGKMGPCGGDWDRVV